MPRLIHITRKALKIRGWEKKIGNLDARHFDARHFGASYGVIEIIGFRILLPLLLLDH